MSTDTVRSAEPVTPLLNPKAEPFDSVTALREEHNRLTGEYRRASRADRKKGTNLPREIVADATGGAGAPAPKSLDDVLEDVRRFVERAQVTGARIGSRADRDAAQGALDYWTATLFDLPPERRPVKQPVTLAPFDEGAAPDLADKSSPFKGLEAFGQKDAKLFFGRADAIQDLLERIRTHPVVVVAGPSGSGKSSLVLAGLLPELERDYRIFPVVVPGTDPLAELAKAVCPPDRSPVEWVAEVRPVLARNPQQFAALARSATDPRPVVLVVDQLEELFSLAPDEATRERFAAAVMSLVAGERPLNRVVLTVRQDYDADTRQLGPLKPVFADPAAVYTPPPIPARELRQIIVQPAAAIGLEFDEWVVDELVKEVSGQLTALPLLQFALSKLWDNRSRNRITRETYQLVGAPQKALQTVADAVYAGLRLPERQSAAKLIFRELVQPVAGREAEYVRKRVRRETLHKLVDPGRVDGVLDEFVKAKLVRQTLGTEAADDRFEVVHEALIRNWELLDGWLREKRQQTKELLDLEATARLWRTAEPAAREAHLLYGPALENAKRYAAASTEVEEFVRASQSRVDLRRRVFNGVLIAAIFLLLIWSVVLWRISSRSARDAERNALSAAQARAEAEANRRNLEHQQREFLELQQRAFAPVRFPTQQQVRPLQPGISIGGPRAGTSGVLTMFVRLNRDSGARPPGAKDDDVYLLTVAGASAAGVLPNGAPVYQPAPPRTSRNVPRTAPIAHVSYSVPVDPNKPNRAAGVVARLVPEFQSANWSARPFAVTGPPAIAATYQTGDWVYMIGHSAIWRAGRIRSTAGRAWITSVDPSGDWAEFENLIEVEPVGGSGQFSQWPDRGAPVVSETGAIVGVVLDSAPRGNRHVTYLLPIMRVLEALKAEPAGRGAPKGAKE